MHLYQFFGLAAIITAPTALAVPTQLHSVVAREFEPSLDSRTASSLTPEHHILARTTTGDSSVTIPRHNPIAPNAVAVDGPNKLNRRVAPIPSAKRRNLFTIALKGGYTVFQGVVNWALEADLDTSSGITTLEANPIPGSSPNTLATFGDYVFTKNVLGSAYRHVTATAHLYFTSPAGIKYTFKADIAYGLTGSGSNLLITDIEYFDVVAATQQLVGHAAQVLPLADVYPHDGDL